MRRRYLIGKRGRAAVHMRKVTVRMKDGKPMEGPDGKPMVDEEGPMIIGYASVFYDGTPETQFELWPGVVERIMPGAFAEAVKGDVAGLRNHNPDMLLGRTTADPPTLMLEEDKTGLRYEIMPPDSPCGHETVESIRRGDLQGSSFAFNITKETWVEEKTKDGFTIEVRQIEEVILYDVGPVTFPAYEASSTGLRSTDGDVAEARASYEKWRATREAKRRAPSAASVLSRGAIMARARVVELVDQG